MRVVLPLPDLPATPSAKISFDTTSWGTEFFHEVEMEGDDHEGMVYAASAMMDGMSSADMSTTSISSLGSRAFSDISRTFSMRYV